MAQQPAASAQQTAASAQQPAVVSRKKHLMLDGNRYYIPHRLARMDEINRDLVVEVTDYFNNPVRIPLYASEKDYVAVPRLYGIANYGRPQFGRQSEGVAIYQQRLAKVCFHLYEAQQSCVNAIHSRFFAASLLREGMAGGTLNLACGKGKTHIGIQCIADVGRRTLVVCHSNVTVSQWVVSIRRSLPDLIVAEYHGAASGSKQAEEVADVVVATIHPLIFSRSAASSSSSSGSSGSSGSREWLATFGLVIYDEIHIYGANKFSRIFDIVRAKRQLGLSATPDRNDGMDRVFQLKVGPTLDAQAELGIAPPTFDVTVYPLIPPPPSKTAVVAAAEGRNASYAMVVKSITQSSHRIDYLITVMRSHFDSHPFDNMLIFCNFIDEVNQLHAKLTEAFPTMLIGCVCEDLSAESIAVLADTARVLICTYKKGGTGFSPVRFQSAVIWSTTRAMITQAVGRIQRWRDEEGVELGPEGSWNAMPRTIYDLIDRCTPASQQYYHDSRENERIIRSRRAVYIAAGYRICAPRSSAGAGADASAGVSASMDALTQSAEEEMVRLGFPIASETSTKTASSGSQLRVRRSCRWHAKH